METAQSRGWEIIPGTGEMENRTLEGKNGWDSNFQEKETLGRETRMKQVGRSQTPWGLTKEVVLPTPQGPLWFSAGE